MLKDTISKLYSFIIKLVILLEEELDKLNSNKFKPDILVKKNITDTLHKLTHLIIVLNKLNKEEIYNEKPALPQEDTAIIDSFLRKYNDSGK
jgi:hypothetical protein